MKFYCYNLSSSFSQLFLLFLLSCACSVAPSFYDPLKNTFSSQQHPSIFPPPPPPPSHLSSMNQSQEDRYPTPHPHVHPTTPPYSLLCVIFSSPHILVQATYTAHFTLDAFPINVMCKLIF